MMRSISWVIAAAIAISGCGDNFESPGPDTLVLDPATAALKVGESAVVSATFHKHGAAVIGGSVSWSSNDPTHVTVSGAGSSATITAVGAGGATITATGQGLVAESTITVSPATLTGIAIAPPVPSLPAGTTQALTVVATYSDQSSADITGSVTWTSDQPAIAILAGNVLTGVARGDTTITATYQGLFSSTHVFVTDAVLQAIEITPATPAIVVHLTEQFTATGHFSDATTRDLTTSVAWTSSTAGIATISNAAGSNGLATALATGTTTISATSGGITGMTTLTVDPSVLVSIAVMPGTPDIAVTADQQFTALGTFSDHSTMDITPTVTWSSSDPTIATIGADGLASTFAVGSTTVTAQRGAISGSTVASVVLPAVGPWLPAAGFSGRPCHDAVKFSMASDLVWVCTATNGLLRGTVAPDTSITFAPVDLGPGAHAGLAIAAHTQNPAAAMFMTAPSGTANNWFRSNDGVAFSPFALLDSAGNGRFLYVGRFQMGIGNILGSWDPGTAGAPQAVVLTGGNPPAAVHPVATATGTVRSIAAATVNSALQLYVSVLGETPTGAPATGGIFHSANSAVTWTETDAGIAAADRDQVFTLVIDPASAMNLYAGVRGGGRIYKTTDGGASWTASATGIPTRARLSVLLVSPQDSMTLFAATDRGLYKSADAGASWTLAGFQGRAVTGVAQSSAAASLILVAVDDEVGLYRAQ